MERKYLKFSFSPPPKKDFHTAVIEKAAAEKSNLRLATTEDICQVLLSFTARMNNKVGISRFLYEVAIEKNLNMSCFFEASKKNGHRETKKHELPAEVQKNLIENGYYVFSQDEERFLQKLRNQVINSDQSWWLYNGHFLQVMGIRHPSGMMAQLFLPNVWWGKRPWRPESDETDDLKLNEISVASEWNQIEFVAGLLFSIDTKKFDLVYAAHKHDFHETVTCRNLMWQIPSAWPLGSLLLSTFPFSIGKIGRVVDLFQKTRESAKEVD